MTWPDFSAKQCIFYFSSKESKLKFKADNLVIVDEKNKTLHQHSCHRVFALYIIGNITLTNVVLNKARHFGFPVVLLGYNLKPNGSFHSRAEGNVLLRKRQYNQAERDLDIARLLVRQKIHNQMELLRRVRYRSHLENDALKSLDSLKPENATNEKTLLGIEGNASRIFFPVYYRKINWERREPRTKRDIPNLLLDIGYTYLFNFIEAIVGIYGFDIYCGVYHKFFYQRKSLICDLVEPFRCIIDHRLRKSYSLKQIDENDFQFRHGQYQLDYSNQSKYTGIFMRAILEHKEEIFHWLQAYYRFFMKGKNLDNMPVYHFKTKAKKNASDHL